MIANLKVSEALSGRIQKGQVTTVYSDSKPGVPITGQVQGVSVLAESGGWRDPNRRDYTVKVLLDADPSMGLKPSMRCRGEIMLGEVKDAITVPIQSVFRKGRTAYVYLKVSGGYAENPVTLGRASEMDVESASSPRSRSIGLAGTRVVPNGLSLNPLEMTRPSA